MTGKYRHRFVSLGDLETMSHRSATAFFLETGQSHVRHCKDMYTTGLTNQNCKQSFTFKLKEKQFDIARQLVIHVQFHKTTASFGITMQDFLKGEGWPNVCTVCYGVFQHLLQSSEEGSEPVFLHVLFFSLFMPFHLIEYFFPYYRFSIVFFFLLSFDGWWIWPPWLPHDHASVSITPAIKASTKRNPLVWYNIGGWAPWGPIPFRETTSDISELLLVGICK